MSNIYDLTVIVPGIRPHNWNMIYDQLKESVGPFTFEVIAIGPKFPDAAFFSDKLNFRFIRDFGHPSRCLQIASEFAKGKFLCWLPDDIILEKGSLQKCLEFMADKPVLDGMTLKYSEGTGFTGNQPEDESYWIARTHQDQRVEGVKEGWKIAPVFLYYTETFIKVGGLDCRFEHINFNTHDLAYRIQSAGGTIHLSPCKVFSADWTPNDSVVSGAHYQNDLPLFVRIYSDPSNLHKRAIISFDNWKQQSPFWYRRYGKTN